MYKAIANILTKIALVALLACGALGLFSCSEQAEIGEYDNWQERNQHYVDSIAQLANSHTDGWNKIVSYTLNDTIEALAPNNNHYVYYKLLEKGQGERMPHYSDSIRVHYMGRLIPSDAYPQGYIFDRSYTNYVLNEQTDVPSLLKVSSVVNGFSTALMHMHEGDRWLIVVPHELGYGSEETNSGKIPAYSALSFDIKLARIYRYKVDTNTSWY